MSTKKPFWQELVLQSAAPALALLGVTITVRPDIIGESNSCNKLVTASLDGTGIDDKAAPKSVLPDIQATSSNELPTSEETMPEIAAYYDYSFSLPHFAILIACLILLVQIIRLVHNWKK